MAAQRSARAAGTEQDATILVRSLQIILRNLARLLVGRMTLRHVLDLFRDVYVQEAEARLRRERPGKNVPLSRLALLTGLDTRTLIRIRGDLAQRQARGDDRVRISELSPEAKLVETWAQNPRYRDRDTGRPRDLSYKSAGSEFEQLVRQVITARGVTVQSTLERLLATHCVEKDPEEDRLVLLTDRFSPFNTEDELSLMATGMQAIINLTDTIDHNVHSAKPDRLIQRELWTFRLNEERRREFRAKVREFLERVEREAEGTMVPMESPFEAPDQLTAGLGFYYFEENAPSPDR
jgi:hypothetical protein